MALITSDCAPLPSFKVMGPDFELMQINVRTTIGGQPAGQSRGWHRDMESVQEGWSHPTVSTNM